MSDTERYSRIRLRLPVMGWIYVMVTVVIAMSAVKTQVAMLFLISGAMLGALVVSGAMARSMVRAIRLRREVSDRAWQNQPLHLGYYLRNTRRWGSCLGITVEEVAPKGIQSAAGFCVHVGPAHVFRAGARFVARNRGKILLARSCVGTAFPFGLIHALRFIDKQAAIVIWPARGKLKRQLLDRGAVAVSTSAPTSASGGQDEFFGLREYRPDDNPRWIHWRKSAARVAPVIREMSRTRPEVLWVILDTHCPETSDLWMAQREKLLRFTATLVDHALARGYQVGLGLAYRDGPAVHEPSAGRAHRCTLLDALAQVDVNTAHPLHSAMEKLRPRSLTNSQVIVVTPLEGPESQGSLRLLRGRCRHVSVINLPLLERVFEDDPLCAEGA